MITIVPARKATHRSRVAALGLALVIASVPVAAKKRVAEVRVESRPSGAMVSVAPAGGALKGVFSTVAGETPLSRSFRFPKKYGLLLRFEKRGYEPLVVEIDRDATELAADLMPADIEIEEPAPVRVLAVVRPDFEVIRRGFASEREDQAAGEAAADALVASVQQVLADEVKTVEVDDRENRRQTRTLWRDARTRMELVDPIRLPYLTVAPTFESRAAREALTALAESTGCDAVLFIAGKATVETGGMKAGKIGIMAAGTASSFASGYSSAMASGNDFFTYNIYLPDFAEGLALEALVVDLRTAAVRWANKGMWDPVPVNRPELTQAVMADLLTGLTMSIRTPNQPTTKEEGP